MAQLTIYLNKDLELAVRNRARKTHETVSRWIARAVEKQISEEWPMEVHDLAGSWKDFPEVEELRSEGGTDIKREAFSVRTGYQ